MKQTAVEQLEEYLGLSLGKDRMRLLANEFEKAKELEKQQIIKAYDCTNSMAMYGEDYYNETFKSE